MSWKNKVRLLLTQGSKVEICCVLLDRRESRIPIHFSCRMIQTLMGIINGFTFPLEIPSQKRGIPLKSPIMYIFYNLEKILLYVQIGVKATCFFHEARRKRG